MAVPSLIAFRMAQSFTLKKSESAKQMIKAIDFPCEKEWEANFSLAMLMLDRYIIFHHFKSSNSLIFCRSSSWQRRKMVWTKEFVYFAREGQNISVDTIPLQEIVSVTAMKKKTQRRKTMSFITLNGPTSSATDLMKDYSKSQRELDASTVRKIENDSSGSLDRLVQIKTVPEGFNSGRTYFLQANSEEQSHKLVERLQKNVNDAMQRAAVKSRFQTSQEKVKKIYCSLFFQGMITFLIISVNLLNQILCMIASIMIHSY